MTIENNGNEISREEISRLTHIRTIMNMHHQRHSAISQTILTDLWTEKSVCVPHAVGGCDVLCFCVEGGRHFLLRVGVVGLVALDAKYQCGGWS
jgi:hypothetical protein